jgi:hypothetical protein
MRVKDAQVMRVSLTCESWSRQCRRARMIQDSDRSTTQRQGRMTKLGRNGQPVHGTPCRALPTGSRADHRRSRSRRQRQTVVATCALASELLGDMGAHQPHVLTPDGDIPLA